MTVSVSTFNEMSTSNNYPLQVKNEISHVPRKASGIFTDMQLRKIGLVALAVILVIGPILAGICSGGVGGLVMGGFYSIMTGTLGGLFAWINWPTADYQTAEGAAFIRNDLKTKSLTELHSSYNFSDLAYYGYITKENADRMERMYKGMPSYMRERDEIGYREFDSMRLEMNVGIHEEREKIERQFNHLRHSLVL